MKMEKLVELINGLELPGVSARYTGNGLNEGFILEIEGRFEESFGSLEEMSEVLNSRNLQENDTLLDDLDQAICDAARKAGLLF